jgi:hypothetical protein
MCARYAHAGIASLLAFVGFADAAGAASVAFDSQSEWQTAVGGASAVTVFHFDGPTELGGKFANDPTIVPSYSSQGVDFLPFTGSSIYPLLLRGQAFQIPQAGRDGLLANNVSPNPTADLDGRAIKFNFNIPARSVGVFTNQNGDGDGGVLRAFDSAMNPIGEVDLQPGVFGGLITDTPIAHVAIINTFNADINFGIWDLQFSQNGLVPEPGSAGVLVLGVAAARRPLRKRRR